MSADPDRTGELEHFIAVDFFGAHGRVFDWCMVRVLQVSDSHLSAGAPYADRNWQAVLDHVDATRPDLVVHTGDISCNGAGDINDLRHAYSQLDRLSVPWRAIPGNHDIGDFGDGPQRVSDARRRRYAAIFGDLSWSFHLGGIKFVGIDVQTLLSDLPAGAELWEWLGGELDTSEPVALFVHRPLLPWHPAELDDPNRYVTEPGRGRLADLLHNVDLRLVASGHVHQWRAVEHGQTGHVWAPSTWATLPEHIQPTIGTKVVGCVDHELDPAAERGATSTLVQPPGVVQVTIGEDFASPYEH